MKTGNTIKIILGVLLIFALMSATAFAFAGQPKIDEAHRVELGEA